MTQQKAIELDAGTYSVLSGATWIIRKGRVMSSCCSTSVSDPSGEGIEGRCTDCGEMCEIVREEQ